MVFVFPEGIMGSVLLLYIAVAGKPCLQSTQKLLQSPLIQKFSINGDEPNRRGFVMKSAWILLIITNFLKVWFQLC